MEQKKTKRFQIQRSYSFTLGSDADLIHDELINEHNDDEFVQQWNSNHASPIVESTMPHRSRRKALKTSLLQDSKGSNRIYPLSQDPIYASDKRISKSGGEVGLYLWDGSGDSKSREDGMNCLVNKEEIKCLIAQARAKKLGIEEIKEESEIKDEKKMSRRLSRAKAVISAIHMVQSTHNVNKSLRKFVKSNESATKLGRRSSISSISQIGLIESASAKDSHQDVGEEKQAIDISRSNSKPMRHLRRRSMPEIAFILTKSGNSIQQSQVASEQTDHSEKNKKQGKHLRIDANEQDQQVKKEGGVEVEKDDEVEVEEEKEDGAKESGLLEFLPDISFLHLKLTHHTDAYPEWLIERQDFCDSLETMCIQIINKQPEHRTDFDVRVLTQIVRRYPFFNTLGDQKMASLCRAMRFRLFKPGQPVFCAGDIGMHFYVVFSGSVAVVSPTTGNFLAVLGPGATFGEFALNRGTSGRRSATVLAIESESSNLKRNGSNSVTFVEPSV